MKIAIKNDGDGFLAEVDGSENIFAYGSTENEAKSELLNVVEMMLDFHLEQVEKERKLRNYILETQNFSRNAV